MRGFLRVFTAQTPFFLNNGHGDKIFDLWSGFLQNPRGMPFGAGEGSDLPCPHGAVRHRSGFPQKPLSIPPAQGNPPRNNPPKTSPFFTFLSGGGLNHIIRFLRAPPTCPAFSFYPLPSSLHPPEHDTFDKSLLHVREQETESAGSVPLCPMWLGCGPCVAMVRYMG